MPTKINYLINLILLILLTTLFSCNNQNTDLEDNIVSHLEQSNDTIFLLSDVTKFKWDKLLVCKETVTIEQINNALGYHYPYYEDVGERLIFLNSNGKIEYHQDKFPNVEGIYNEQVIFEIPDSLDIRQFNSGKFIAHKRNKDGITYYLIDQK